MRIYDDIWTANIAGVPCLDMTSAFKDRLDALYPTGWEANTHLLLMTLGSPYEGLWHHDGRPGETDTIALMCLAGRDEIEYDGKASDLLPGHVLLLPAGNPHRGSCSDYRVTYHCRVGPKGKVMPESQPNVLPYLTWWGGIKRTYRTLRYWLR